MNEPNLLNVVVNGVMYFAGVGMIGYYIRSLKGIFEKEVSRLDKCDEGLRKDIDHHGHRGLDIEGCQVVRT